MKIAGRHIQHLQSYAALQGINISDLSDPIDGEAHYPAAIFLNLLEELYLKSNDELLGFHLAQQLKLESLGLIYQISLLSSNVFEALNHLSQYLEQSFPLVSVSLTSLQNDKVRLVVTVEDSAKHLEHILAEHLLLIMYTEMLAMTKNRTAITLFSHHQSHHDSINHFYVQKNEFTGLEFDKQLLNKSLDELQKMKLGTLLPAFLAQLESHSTPSIPTDTPTKVKIVLLKLASPFFPDLQQVAAFLNKSTRTLQRELTAESTSFRQIANEVKIASARLLLLNDQLSVNEIAYMMGYSAPSAFWRHFKKAMAISPRNYRKEKIKH